MSRKAGIEGKYGKNSTVPPPILFNVYPEEIITKCIGGQRRMRVGGKNASVLLTILSYW